MREYVRLNAGHNLLYEIEIFHDPLHITTNYNGSHVYYSF
jgi:hypothetical protein